MVKFVEKYYYGSGNEFYDEQIRPYESMIDWEWGIWIIDNFDHIVIGCAGGYGNENYDEYYKNKSHITNVKLNIPIKMWRDKKLNELLNDKDM